MEGTVCQLAERSVMSDIKDVKKFDNDIEVLSMEDLCDEKANTVVKKKKLNKGQKVLLGICLALCLLLLGGAGIFLGFRSIGEKSLKAEAKEDFILYNGEKFTYRKDVINILCLGIDKAEAMEKKIESRNMLGMADAILLASIDTEKKELKIIAIPRDTMTNVTALSETGEPKEKINLQLCYQYSFGGRAEQSGELMTQAVSELLYNVPIEKFCAINFEALPVLNDAIGGVDVVVQEDLTAQEPKFVLGEEIHLEGGLALKYVRERNKTVVDSVVLRTQRQKQYALAFLEKAKKAVADDMSIPITVFQELQENMSTNVSIADITYLVPELLEMSISEDIIQMLPGESVPGEEFLEYHVDKDALKELVIDTFYEKVE